MFVSYSHRDYERIDPVLRDLRARGYRFWYDEGIDPGTEWPESIAKHLERSSLCLSFISPYSADSKNCRREINFALSRNIPMISVFLEDTKISPGLEMQIATYQSIMAYKYPDLSSLMERIVSVDVTEPCRGPAGTSAAGGISGTSAVPKKRHAAPAAAVLLILAAAALFFWYRSGSGPEEISDGTAEPAETALPTETALAAETALPTEAAPPAVTALPAVTPVPTDPPAEGDLATPEGRPRTGFNWTDHLWDTVPVTPNDPLPEGYRVLVYGEWGYGSSLLVFGNDEGSIRFALTDERIPDGYPMSQDPGKNDPYWNVMLPISARETLQVIIDLTKRKATSFTEFDTDVLLIDGNDYTSYSGFLYSLTGNTLIFEIRLPEQFTTDDITAAHISLGTELGDFVDTYEFYS